MEKWENREKVCEKVYRFLKKENFYTDCGSDWVGVLYSGHRMEIVFDRLQGRSSIIVDILGVKVDCLLDTGTRINVLSEKCLSNWPEVQLEISDDKLRCANGSGLVTKGKVRLEVQFGEMIKEVEFVVVP